MKISKLSKFGELINLREDAEIKDISYDSRRVKKGDLFIALIGRNFDGHIFVEDAFKHGAVAAVVSKKLDINIPQLLVPDTREAMANISAFFYHYPSKYLHVTGVTGTNGKSTTVFIIHKILKKLRQKSSLVGTIEYEIAGKHIKADRTTPESPDIQKFMYETWKNDGKFFNMEVSSQSICEKRVENIKFSSAVFTNLSREHLEYHKTFENYKKAKLEFFKKAARSGATAYFNSDDPHYEDFLRVFINSGGKRYYTYAIKKHGDIRAIEICLSLEGAKFSIAYKGEKYHIKSKLIGTHNVYNILAAFGVLINSGFDPHEISLAIQEIPSVPGRLEKIEKHGINFFIDYAHTPEALRNVMQSLRKLTSNRIIIVFGAGGNRDAGKRPLMGSIASKFADFIILTSDNPRSEDPLKIVNDIKSGISGDNYLIEIDREKAIRKAFSLARTGDVILVAGKGHEEYQEVRGKKYHFSDREVILAL